MKTDIHPIYGEATVTCSCGNTFTTESTKPVLRVELCNECHPFYTASRSSSTPVGASSGFQRRYAKRRGARAEA